MINIKQIMVPTDLTEESDAAIEFGMGLAKQLRAHLILLHVYQESYYDLGYILGPQPEDTIPQTRRHFERTLESLAEKVRKECPDCTAEFRDGVPCEEIVRMARERGIDLIVVSTHHYNWLTRLACGCDAEQILRNAPCPVLIMNARNNAPVGG